MSITNWGLLTKSATDSETIEEAIARLIQAHDADETSHLETGEALQSHKASDIIDHLADSVVADKIKDLELSDIKMSDDRFLYQTVFTDLAVWQEYNYLGGDVSGGIGRVSMAPADVAGSYASIVLPSVDANEAVNFTRSPKFSVGFFIDSVSKGKFYIVAGSFDIGAFGFKVENSKLYALHVHNENEYTTEINVSYSFNVRNHVTAVLYSGERIDFYLNGVLVATHTENLPDTDDDDNFSQFCDFWCERVASGFPELAIHYFKFSQLFADPV